ncbi:MAG: hypothetical protein Q8O99_00180, partial [bacterium]|nr:hypothetical protein [bacterium]
MQKTHKTLWTILIVIVLVSMILISVLPYVNAQEVPHDLSVNSRGISFSQSNFFAGDTIRIYGTVENVGTKDMTGYVQFFKGITPIQNEIPLSSKASGAPEEVWVDWIAEEGTYNIQFRILDST